MSNLMGHWPGSTYKPTWEPRHLVDGSGNGNNAILIDSPQYGLPSIGGGECIYFNGTNHACVGHDASLNFGLGSFSVCLWVNFTIGTGQQKMTIGKGYPHAPGYAGFGLSNWVTDDPVPCRFYLSDGSDVIHSEDSWLRCDRGKWYFLAFVINKSTNKLMVYKDGEYVNQVSISSIGDVDNTHDLLFGSCGGNMSDVKLDEIRLYNGALSADEVRALYNLIVLPIFTNNAAALAGGLIPGQFYRAGDDPDLVCITH